VGWNRLARKPGKKPAEPDRREDTQPTLSGWRVRIFNDSNADQAATGAEDPATDRRNSPNFSGGDSTIRGNAPARTPLHWHERKCVF
jgi:hypothetical protein